MRGPAGAGFEGPGSARTRGIRSGGPSTPDPGHPTERRVDRAAATIRTGTAALALAVALFLLLRIPLIATFRAALILLAALEVLAFGRRLLAREPTRLLWVEILVRLAVLTVAYLVLAG